MQNNPAGAIIAGVILAGASIGCARQYEQFRRARQYNLVRPTGINAGKSFSIFSDHGPGIINNFYLADLEPTPWGPWARSIKPWLLTDKYPNTAVFVSPDSLSRYNLVFAYASPSYKYYGLKESPNRYTGSIDFNNLRQYTRLLTDDTWHDVESQLNSVRKWLVRRPDLRKMVYGPLKKLGARQSTLFISAELYDYDANNANTDEDWAITMKWLKTIWTNPATLQDPSYYALDAAGELIDVFNTFPPDRCDLMRLVQNKHLGPYK
jgi:hypothetical protein